MKNKLKKYSYPLIIFIGFGISLFFTKKIGKDYEVISVDQKGALFVNKHQIQYHCSNTWSILGTDIHRNDGLFVGIDPLVKDSLKYFVIPNEVVNKYLLKPKFDMWQQNGAWILSIALFLLLCFNKADDRLIKNNLIITIIKATSIVYPIFLGYSALLYLTINSILFNSVVLIGWIIYPIPSFYYGRHLKRIYTVETVNLLYKYLDVEAPKAINDKMYAGNSTLGYSLLYFFLFTLFVSTIYNEFFAAMTIQLYAFLVGYVYTKR